MKLPNRYCVGPGGSGPPVDAEAPVFPVDRAELRRAWEAVVARLPRTRKSSGNAGEWVLEYETRSRVFRFPDLVTIELLALGGRRSTFRLSSRARYGLYDFGVNRRRVLRLMRALTDELSR